MPSRSVLTTMLTNVGFSAVRRTVTQSLCRSSSTYNASLTERRSDEVGVGGRGSDAGAKVAIFGANGFLGPYVSTELGNHGFMAYFANRGDDMEMRFLKPMFDLGRSRYVFYSPRDRDSIKEVIADADVVVNMIGKYWETWQPVQTDKFPYIGTKMNYTYRDTNVDIARTIAEVCREMQVDNLIHVSSAAASPDSPSEWARTKYEGEQAVKEAYPWATIFRPTQLYGTEDFFLNWLATISIIYGVVPLVNGGKALTQPVLVNDVAKAMYRVIDNPEPYEGKTIDCFGPQEYTYQELAEFVHDITEKRHRPIVGIPKVILKRLAGIVQYNRFGTNKPWIVPDLVELWSEDYMPSMTSEEYAAQEDNAEKILTLSDLGISPTPIEKVAFSYLHRFRYQGKFGQIDGYRN